MIGLDISTSSVKLVELGRAPPVSSSSSDLPLNPSRRAGSPMVRSRSSTRSPRPFDGWSARAAHAQERGDGHAAVGRDHQEDHVACRPSRGRARDAGRERGQPVHPVFTDEVSLDFCVIGPSPTSVGDVEVLIAASRKDRVQDRQGLAEAAGLKRWCSTSRATRPAGDEPHHQALPNEGKDALVALFEIGADTTSLKVLRDDEMLYDRDQAFGGAQLTAADLTPVRLLVRGSRVEETRRRPARGLRVVDPRPVRRQPVAGDRPCPAVLLHQHTHHKVHT